MSLRIIQQFLVWSKMWKRTVVLILINLTFVDFCHGHFWAEDYSGKLPKLLSKEEFLRIVHRFKQGFRYHKHDLDRLSQRVHNRFCKLWIFFFAKFLILPRFALIYPDRYPERPLSVSVFFQGIILGQISSNFGNFHNSWNSPIKTPIK